MAHFAAADEDDLNELVRVLLSYLPSNNLDNAPRFETGDDPDRLVDELDAIAPENSNKPYDMHEVIRATLDDGDFLEVQAAFARNIICGFGRLDGYSVGVVANQPQVLAGTLDIDASEKAARFVRFCDAFSIPLVVFEDVPGFLPGTDQEYAGIIRHGSKLLYAFCEATVPRVTVITRKAYGGAYVVMNSRNIGADFVCSWPTGEIAVMGPEAAVNLLFRRELADADDPVALRNELKANYADLFSSPYQAAARGYIDDVIVPRETRRWLIRSLELARNETGAHSGPQAWKYSAMSDDELELPRWSIEPEPTAAELVAHPCRDAAGSRPNRNDEPPASIALGRRPRDANSCEAALDDNRRWMESMNLRENGRARAREIGIVIGTLPTGPKQRHHRCRRREGRADDADLR